MSAPLVALLHGLGRTHRSMSGLRDHLTEEGFNVLSPGYPSRHRCLEELADQEVEAIRKVAGDRPVAAVTHSLGGILVRLMRDRLPWSRVVMLAPPNRGSKVATALGEHPLFGWFFGPAGREIAQAANWPAPPEPFAVIAGTLGPSVGNPPSWGVRALRLLPPDEPNDGLLTVSSTRLEGMKDFATVPASHTWIMDHPRTRELTVRFLRTGSFQEEQ